MSTKEEAVAAAKQLEVDGRAFYLDKAKTASSEALRSMFASLADDEAKHLEWLDKLLPGIDSAASANKDLFARLKTVFTGPVADKAETDIEAIDVAIGMEDKALEAYTAWVDSGESDEIKKLGTVLVGVESFHRQVLENAKEYLNSPGDWFTQDERWSFEGG